MLIDINEAIEYTGEVFGATTTLEHFELAQKYAQTVMLFMKDDVLQQYIDKMSEMTETTKLRLKGETDA